MVLDSLIIPFAEIAYRWVKYRVKQLGYTLMIHIPSNGWIPSTMIFDMTPIWQKAGIDAKGVNFFTIGNISSGLSARYDENSLYYQSWLGGYLVKFKKTRNWAVEDHFRLAKPDQNTWLSMYGDPKPLAEMDFSTIKKLQSIKVSGYKTTIYSGGGFSHSDMGDGKKSLLFPFLMSGFAYFMRKDNSRLNISGNQLQPYWLTKSRVDPYQKIWLEGVVAIVEIEENIKAVLYGNGATFTDKNGKKYSTFPKLKDEFLKFISQTEIQKIS